MPVCVTDAACPWNSKLRKKPRHNTFRCFREACLDPVFECSACTRCCSKLVWTHIHNAAIDIGGYCIAVCHTILASCDSTFLLRSMTHQNATHFLRRSVVDVQAFLCPAMQPKEHPRRRKSRKAVVISGIAKQF